MTTSDQPRVLFLCTGNSCRSQMAEGFARAQHGASLEVCSAGTAPQGLNPLAVRAMREVGIDISEHESKTLEACEPERLDLVVTVCGSAHEQCPVFSGRTRVWHQGFDDPPHLARDAASDEEAMPHYRRVRDEIGEWMRGLPQLIVRLNGERA